jgi:16S rRNA (guanine(966)-N(2))-methyltransferase RsmD
MKISRCLRPTTSKVKEAIFDILGQEIKEACFLDLYAGTGTIGFEALSRGASEVFFVETNKSYAKKIKHLVEKYGFTEKIRIATKKVLPFIRGAEINRLLFDIIFLDPPYHTDEITYALSAIGKSNILKQKGIVIAEHFKKRQLPERFDKLQKIKDYKYGDTVLSLYRMAFLDADKH